MEKFMMVDNIAVAIKDEKNVLEVIRKAGIDLPTFCYYSDLSIYGACRMCVVEDQWGGIEASCSMVPKEGMVVFTNTERLRKYRKNILELLLAEHCTDCTTCYRNLSCKLQSLALRFGINMTKYNYTKPEMQRDTSSLCIERHPEKCILCGDCVRMCAEVQNVGVIDFMHRGSKMTVDTAFGTPLAETNCVGCGQCAAVCPTGAIIVKRNINPIWEAITDKNTRVVVQIAPAVRVGIGRELGMEPGQNSMGRIVAVLRRMGFDQVFDTSTGADLTVMEETKEFVARLEKGEKLPLFTSCCPAWIQQVENQYPEL